VWQVLTVINEGGIIGSGFRCVSEIERIETVPKLELVFTDQINFLAVRGTADQLRAIAYYRGDRGRFAGPARDFLDKGIRDFVAALSPKERARYEEILASVKIANTPPV
jgi:hypothetical protein